MRNRNYEIGREGVDSISESSHPASDRISDYNDTLYDRTGDMYSNNNCGCEIDSADREKRIEELDELIHDKIGDTDKYMKERNKEQYNIYDNTVNNNILKNGGETMNKDNKSNVSGNSCSSTNDKYSSMKDDKSNNYSEGINNTSDHNSGIKNNTSDHNSGIKNNTSDHNADIQNNTSNDLEGCGCGVGYMDDDTTPNRIDNSGDDWVVERIDIWVDDSADSTPDTGSVYDNQIGDTDRNQQNDSSYRNKTNNAKSDTDSGMSC